ncbi:hypothetical protein FS837_000854, partial [Tulasnella sp. UAMH 9824]
TAVACPQPGMVAFAHDSTAGPTPSLLLAIEQHATSIPPSWKKTTSLNSASCGSSARQPIDSPNDRYRSHARRHSASSIATAAVATVTTTVTTAVTAAAAVAAVAAVATVAAAAAATAIAIAATTAIAIAAATAIAVTAVTTTAVAAVVTTTAAAVVTTTAAAAAAFPSLPMAVGAHLALPWS